MTVIKIKGYNRIYFIRDISLYKLYYVEEMLTAKKKMLISPFVLQHACIL